MRGQRGQGEQRGRGQRGGRGRGPRRGRGRGGINIYINNQNK